MNGITNWTFLNEPLSRWFLFIGAMTFIVLSWKVINGYIVKGMADVVN